MPVDLDEIEAWFHKAKAFMVERDQEAADSYLGRIGLKALEIAAELRAARARIAELEAIANDLEAQCTDYANKVAALESARQPRPMAEAPRDGTPIIWQAEEGAQWHVMYWPDYVECFDLGGVWLPCPNKGDDK